MRVLHYETKKGFDVIDVATEYDLNFNTGSTVKYLCRAGKKEGESKMKDLLKAQDFLEREIKYLRSLEV